MRKRTGSGILIVAMLTGLLISAFNVQTCRAQTIVVPDDYPTIQGAVNAAITGDTVYVKSGEYHEHIIVSRAISLVGENRETTIIRSSGTGRAVQINSNGVTITGFTIRSGREAGHDGIGLEGRANCRIFGNKLVNNSWSIALIACSNISIADNYMENNQFGVAGAGCSNCRMTENIAVNNEYGIGFDECSYTEISGNDLSNNQEGGFVSDFPYSDNKIADNTIESNRLGVWINFYPNRSVSGNSIERNDIANNEYGIYLHRSSSETITCNDLIGNIFGVWFCDSSGNSFYHNNLITNVQQAYVESSIYASSWDSGYPSGGNYWTDYPGPDTDGDGIGDEPYIIDANNRDNYPLMSPHGGPPLPTYTLTITTTAGGTTDPQPGDYRHSKGQVVPVQAIPDTAYELQCWELDGVNIGSENRVDTVMNSSHDLRAIFVHSLYDLTISARCSPEGTDVGVEIEMDGSVTGFMTPHTFAGLVSSHTFTVPPYDANGHPFKQWNTGHNSTTITVSSSGTYTAIYDAKYTLEIASTIGGSTDPAPATYSYWFGTMISVAAMPESGYYLDYWQLDGVNIGAPDRLTVEIKANHILHASFVQISQGHDVAVKYVYSKPVVGRGCPSTIKVTAMNVGSFTETFNVTAYIDSIPIASQIVTLGSGISLAIDFRLNTSGLTEYQNYTISAYAWPVLDEADMSDNDFTDGIVTITHIGDVNGDGRIDVQDIARVTGAFGSIQINDPNDPRHGQYWHPTPCKTCPHTPNADITGDGKIDIQDLARTSGNFGWHR